MATIETNAELGQQVVADAKRYVLHSWSVQDAIQPIPVAGGEGCWFWDYDGKRYLDFASQLVNVSIGHQHPKVIAAIKEQAERLCTIGPPMATEPRSTLARLLAEVTPGNLAMSFFTNGGAEANENAIKLARWYTGRHKIVARYRSYHGATAGAITATGDPRRWPAEPGVPGFVRMLDPYTYRCPAGHPDPCPVCTGAPHLEELLQYEGPQNVAAVIMETIVGTNGVIVPPDGYLQSIREVCDRHGILLILGAELPRLQERHPSIGEIRGKGLFWGVELVTDRETREPLVPFNGTGDAFAPMAKLMKAAMERGLYLMTHWNVIMVVPPLTITREELAEGIGILDEALALAD